MLNPEIDNIMDNLNILVTTAVFHKLINNLAAPPFSCSNATDSAGCSKQSNYHVLQRQYFI